MGDPAVARILVLGAGAIGSVLGGYLSQAGQDPLLVDGWPEHVDALNRNGLRLEGARGQHDFAVQAVLYDELPVSLPNLELAFVCVKSFDTERAASLLASRLRPDTMIVSTQNGINEEYLAHRLGAGHVLGAVTELGGYLAGPGHAFENRAEGGFIIGELTGTESPRVKKLQAVMQACAPTEVSTNVMGVLWSKLLWNCMLNPLSALTSLGQGGVIADDRVRAVGVRIAREVAAVARAAQVELEPLKFFGIHPGLLASPDPQVSSAVEGQIVERYRTQTNKTTSMGEDVRRGRRTEVDYLNGYVVSKGTELGVAAPVNARVVDLVHRLEKHELAPGMHLLSLLEMEVRADAVD
jgi:2-dehydropantoate 2-reductase